MKKSKSKASPAPKVVIVSRPSHLDISIRAERLWRERGCPPWRDDDIWLDAERELNSAADGGSRFATKPSFSDGSILNSGNSCVMAELDDIFPVRAGRETTSI
jgi:hypothetical protein